MCEGELVPMYDRCMYACRRHRANNDQEGRHNSLQGAPSQIKQGGNASKSGIKEICSRTAGGLICGSVHLDEGK